MSDMYETSTSRNTRHHVAVIGMAGRFPGAPDIDRFWRNLVEGVEAIRRWSREELLAMGAAAELVEGPDFVPAGAQIDDADRFDAGFFGFSPAEAEILDPQQRVFLECAWQALETAGYNGDRYDGAIGIYAAAGINTYQFNLHDNARVRETVSPYELFVASDKDFLATRTAFKLNLRGPAVTVQTACSSSLVAVHMAVQSLLAGECDMALAGGVALARPGGYRAREGGILSADGHCRAFDSRAAGTVPGSGVGVVVLKRLEDALADGDTIDAVVLGSAINNDGARKASFTAPQVDSQAAVIADAQAAAGIDAATIGYVEAHGTGTALGDPIEIAALTRAFRHSTQERGFCAIGSVKTNLGHLDTAAGIAGFIKTVLTLRHGRIPPSLHFESPNPQIDFAASPFFVNARLSDWHRGDHPRRAGVSSFGIGGTNAHVVLEEPPAAPVAAGGDAPQLLMISARSASALAETASALAARLEARPDFRLADVAFTLRRGRQAFDYRQQVVAASRQEAIDGLRRPGDFSLKAAASSLDAVMLFPGQGSQYPAMGKSLYAGLPVFRKHLDDCANLLRRQTGRDFLGDLFSAGDDIHDTARVQPALFTFEYALARSWMEFGVAPRALHGHSIGEYVAACLAGVFDLETALSLVVERGRVMQVAPGGAMLAVFHAGRAIEEWLGDDLALAASNAPGLSVLSGTVGAVARLQERLKAQRIGSRLLKTSHAFHSPMMTQAAAAFREAVSRVTLNPPKLPVISNVTGNWLSAAEATDPDYWQRHLLQPVRFAEGTKTLLSLPDPVFIEVGPGTSLGFLTTETGGAGVKTIAGIGEADAAGETGRFLEALGRFWQAGGDLDWPELAESRRVPLPAYPFQRERYWIDADKPSAAASPAVAEDSGKARLYRPSWRRLPAVVATSAPFSGRFVVFGDGRLGTVLASALERGGAEACRVVAGAAFDEPDYRCFSVPATSPADYRALFDTLEERSAAPDHVVFLWPLTAEASPFLESLRVLIGTLGSRDRPARLTVVTGGAADVTGTEALDFGQAGVAGLLQVAMLEYPALSCRQIDLDPADAGPLAARRLHDALHGEETRVALRGPHRWVPDILACDLPEPAAPARLRQNGVFLVVGNIAEGLGRVWVDALAKPGGVRLALLQDVNAPEIEAPPGIEVMERRLDCTDSVALGEAMDAVSAAWGRIDGIFLSISLINPAAVAPIELLEESHWRYNRASKIAPVEALRKAVANRRIGFCCIQSSLSTLVGGVGLGAYASAYHALDLLVAARNREDGAPWFAINYAVGEAGDADGAAPHGGHVNPFAVPPEISWEFTRRIIEGGLSGQSAIARGDITRRRVAAERPGREEATAGRQRPELATPFVAPRNDIETTVAAIFEDLLGIRPIGVNDGFYELGGHSLLAIRTVAKLREAFPVDIEMRELLFENPTAAGVAGAIAAGLQQPSDLDGMAALLREIEELSDDEVRSQLSGAGAR